MSLLDSVGLNVKPKKIIQTFKSIATLENFLGLHRKNLPEEITKYLKKGGKRLICKDSKENMNFLWMRSK